MPLDPGLDDTFEQAGQEWNVDPRLLKAIALQESTGNPRAVSKVGAQGLMGLMPATGAGLGVTDPYNPVQSIWAGAKYMAQALDAEGTPERALLYYHGGPDWATPQKYGPESQAYPGAILARYQALGQGGAPGTPGTHGTPGGGTSPPAQQPPGQPQQPPGGAARPGQAGEDVDAFLARTAGGRAAAGGQPAAGGQAGPGKTDDVSAFLARTGGAAAPAPAAKSPVPAPAASSTALPAPDFSIPSLAPNLPGDTPGQAGSGAGDTRVDPRQVLSIDLSKATPPPAVGRIASAAREGWGDVNPLMSPDLQRMIERAGPVGYYLTSPLLQAGGAALRAGSAGFKALQQALVEAGGGEAGVGRDIAAALEAAPAADRPLGLKEPPTGPGPAAAARQASAETAAYGAPLGDLYARNRPVPSPAWTPANPLEAAVQRGTDRIEAPLSPAFRDNPLSPAFGQVSQAMQAPTTPLQVGEAEVRIPRRPPETVAESPPGEGQPGSVGAAATAEGSAPGWEMTPAEYKANRKQGELNAVLAGAVPGKDNTTYVPGSVPTLAELMGDPLISQQESLLREREPNKFTARLQQNNQARIALYEDDMGSAPAIEAIKQERTAQAQQDKGRVMAAARPVDLGDAAEVANQILNDPQLRERDAVRKVITPLRDALYDADGELKTDPLAAWGMHDNLMDKLDKAKLDTSTEKYVVSQMLDLKAAIDNSLNRATDNRFQTFLDNYAAHSQRINAMETLQKFRPQLTSGKTGDVQFANFHRWLLGVVKQRGAPGADPAMSLPDSTMQKLIAIDKDLKRANNIDLGKARGSPTNLLFTLAQQMGLGAAHAIVHGGLAATVGPGAANVFAHQALGGVQAKIGQYRLQRRIRKHLAEPAPGPNFLDYTP